MDIRAYIQSGIIESYVLGLASAEEIAEVERMRGEHREVEAAIEEFSVALDQQAHQFAIAPPADVKSRIWEAIRLQEGFEEESASILPVSPLGANKEGNNVIHLNYFRKWRMVAAASIILFITSAVLNFYFYNRYQQQKQAYTALLSDRNNLQANNQVYQTRLQEWQTALEMMADPEMAMIKMPDVSGKNSNLATVFWDKRNKDVYVMPNKLPQPATGKQYQLWALVDGKPVDAGLLNSSCNGVCKMKNIPRAEAFAITLEKQGGSVSPTMAAMMVLGKV